MRKPRAAGVSARVGEGDTTGGRRGSGCRSPRKRRSCGRAETASRAGLPRCARGRSHPARSPRGPWAPRSRSHRTEDRKSTRLNSSHLVISYAVFCLKKKNNTRSGHWIMQKLSRTYLTATESSNNAYIGVPDYVGQAPSADRNPTSDANSIQCEHLAAIF